MIQQFLIDGKSYNVHVLSLKRVAAIKEATKAETTLSGDIFRDPLGTYYNYTMEVMEKDGDIAALDAFWDVITLPVKSHVCVFPYNQRTLTQRMAVSGCNQNIRKMAKGKNEWGTIVVTFTAQAPKVVP